MDSLIEDDGGGVLQMMANNAAASSPTGTVMIASAEPPTAVEMASLNVTVDADGSVHVIWSAAAKLAMLASISTVP